MSEKVYTIRISYITAIILMFLVSLVTYKCTKDSKCDCEKIKSNEYIAKI